MIASKALEVFGATLVASLPENGKKLLLTITLETVGYPESEARQVADQAAAYR